MLPFAGDQFFWADRLARAGIAPPAVGAARVDAARLRSMIEAAQSSAMGERAVGRAMAREDGLAAAVEKIEAAARPSGAR